MSGRRAEYGIVLGILGLASVACGKPPEAPTPTVIPVTPTRSLAERIMVRPINERFHGMGVCEGDRFNVLIQFVRPGMLSTNILTRVARSTSSTPALSFMTFKGEFYKGARITSDHVEGRSSLITTAEETLRVEAIDTASNTQIVGVPSPDSIVASADFNRGNCPLTSGIPATMVPMR